MLTFSVLTSWQRSPECAAAGTVTILQSQFAQLCLVTSAV